MDEQLAVLAGRVRAEAAREGPAAAAHCDHLLGPAGPGELADALTAPGEPLWARETAAFRLGCAGDRRAFESLVLFLNHRDPPRCESAAHALARLGDPRTARAAAALATNALRTAYALHPVRLLAELRAPESAPVLIATLNRLLTPQQPYWRVALACVEGLGSLSDPRAREALTAAQSHPRLAVAATAALRGLP
ncbi:HEAT repeat domain-containing protein [Streptomyces sp. NPDC002073]|uniref:HEAT repeat domain-containing protein n=1 Tax=Streptomyces sp. NBC_00239 TaxID=2903640 RepID=UPI002E2A814B|nr:adenylosuccinate lyase [Streptomyces sp. NBC_00239]